jgi:hypothetical protein
LNSVLLYVTGEKAWEARPFLFCHVIHLKRYEEPGAESAEAILLAEGCGSSEHGKQGSRREQTAGSE